MDVNVWRNGIVLICLVTVGIVFLREKQDEKLHWAIFFSSLYIVISLPVVHYFCSNILNFWVYQSEGSLVLGLPIDLYFDWVVVWGILPIVFTRTKYFWISTLVLFWIDLLIMPYLAKMGILQLRPNWIIGESILISLVFMPSYYWARCYYEDKNASIRAGFQVLMMIILVFVGLPYLLFSFELLQVVRFEWSSILFQLLLIISFPALVATQYLVRIGKGTPFPRDPTQRLVMLGPYAYIRNPIQWTFTFIFLVLAIYHQSFYFLIGIIVSVCYVLGVSDKQEFPDMIYRFGMSYENYKKAVPAWKFLWRPIAIPKGKIYFDMECTNCSQISQWFLHQKTNNLEVCPSASFTSYNLQKVTYIDHYDTHYEGISAISMALQHIHLGWATLGWFIGFPLVRYIFQSIVEALGFYDDSNGKCSIM